MVVALGLNGSHSRCGYQPRERDASLKDVVHLLVLAERVNIMLPASTERNCVNDLRVCYRRLEPGTVAFFQIYRILYTINISLEYLII